MSRPQRLLVRLVVAAAAAATACAATAGPTAHTPCANYVGLNEAFAPLPNAPPFPIAVWRGIRFAAPPVGALRWAAPAPAPGCTPGVAVPATSYGSMCVQNSMLNGAGDEDCLTLNVYAPASATPASALPVLFFIYGGDLTLGSASWYNATATVALFASGTDTGPIIVVVANYRVNTLGFLSTPDLCAVAGDGAGCGNFGIQDQRAAMAWVRSNIYAFGGDATRVTISGQSSGGTSVFAHLTSTAARGLFSAAISWSGSANLTMGAAPKRAQDAAMPSLAGCAGGATPAARVACTRSLPANVLGNSTPAGWDIQQASALPARRSICGTLRRIARVFPRHRSSLAHVRGAQDFDFPTAATADGWHNAGVVYVDGDVVQQPLLAALRVGVVDVPLLVSTMAAEAANHPKRNVSALTDAQVRGEAGACSTGPRVA